ncbi:hypothetical protein [Psychroflexus sp. ALD_RP9]|uniref:hypothetical protein n=1 Tax=Psychroflexus sp. ALD_RP9 TaxID=2777186 RepID=UPI001A8FD075|nr:hypothetical protein [Psychroflexus sp. ALD_RP9]QSS96333.1 hypothetical protein IMZ30_07645 [Psychroflexus sp. ALD_RP9]
MKFFFSFYFILLFTSVNAQIDEPKPPKEPESPQLPRIVAPTPEASSLMKFGEIPVNYSSGLYNLSVPVYSIGTPDLTLPIALKYHSQGVMVNETASSVGISWSLSAGGSISRQIRGKPDDGGVGYLNGVYDNFFTSNTKRVTVFNQLTSLTTPQKDLLPDKFSINLPTISGTFIFDHQTGEARLKSLQNVAIYPQKNQGRITGFELVDGKGIRYILKAVDGVKTIKQLSQEVQHPNI